MCAVLYWKWQRREIFPIAHADNVALPSIGSEVVLVSVIGAGAAAAVAERPVKYGALDTFAVLKQRICSVVVRVQPSDYHVVFDGVPLPDDALVR